VTLRAVLFDVDFTISRPGPELGPDGFVRLGARHGLALDAARHAEARAAAIAGFRHHPELHHDDELWVAFTEDIIRGLGGEGAGVGACAREMVLAWEQHGNFDLYEDAPPVLEELRRYGLRLALVSNTGRELGAFVRHHLLDVDVAIASRAHGRTKPHPSIFEAALAALDVEAAEAVMVGDSLEDDIEGAALVGLPGILIDRDDRHPGFAPRLVDLYGLPAALGLVRPGT
jgi:HAD superfamily hydrolase (TIGR01549 family)